MFAVKQNDLGEPVSYSCSGDGTGGKTFAAFSEMADFFYANQKEESAGEAAANERMKSLQARLASQEKTLVSLGKERREAKEAGDAVYAAFSEIDALLAFVRQMKKDGKSESEINAALASKKAKIKGAEVEIDA
ncbi:MAG: hypothetical protein NTV88_05485 [Candidatus Micrarchaeota archaeon]|nr:hypothetical protein [Candidatus Micrarchaeota archaeon]